MYLNLHRQVIEDQLVPFTRLFEAAWGFGLIRYDSEIVTDQGKLIDTAHRDQQLRDWTSEEGAVHEVWNNCGVDGNKNISILFDIDRILNANVGNTPTQA